MILALKLLTSRAAGPVASVIAILLLFALLGQCQATGSAKRALAKSEDQVVAVKADLSTCKANTSALEASIAGQNAAVDAFKREGDAKAAEAARARQATRHEAERADRAAAALARFKPAGNDLCARMLAVDAAVKENTP